LKKRIILTGGEGYIGSHLNIYLKSKGYDVELYEGDILDFKLEEDRRVDMVIHLAALTGVRASLEQPEEYYRVNVKGFSKVMHECRLERVKLLYASSSNAAEWWSNPYAVTKKINEELACVPSVTPSSDCIGFRPHTVYPGRPDMLFDQLMNDPNQIEYINTSHTRDFTHINDLCSAVLTLVENYSIIEDKVVDIGSGEAVSVLDVARAFGWDGIRRSSPTPHERVNTQADTTTLRKLGWEPKHYIFDEINNIK